MISQPKPKKRKTVQTESPAKADAQVSNKTTEEVQQNPNEQVCLKIKEISLIMNCRSLTKKPKQH